MRFPAAKIRSSVALLALAACVGGSGGGSPPAQVPLQPTLTSIQANIFTPTCAVSGCHAGASPMLGLNLEAGKSATSLINVPSFYGGMDRVEPFDSDNSFLIKKLEGNQLFGDRMPLNANPLQGTQIQVIREWIDNGAQP